jgi:hypothetical protein
MTCEEPTTCAEMEDLLSEGGCGYKCTLGVLLWLVVD